MRSLLFISLILFGAIGFAQTTVTGKVLDENNVPVSGANIIIVGKAEGTVADFDGIFSLTTDTAPPFKLSISAIGYSDGTAEVTENNQVLNISISSAQTLLDEVVISASRTPERIFESPVTVERFGLKEIKNTTAESFYGGLQNLKGIDINTNSLTFQSINSRGFSTFANNRFLQLVDGIDNSAPGLNFVLGNLVGMSELEVQSVEILPGASSALYGAGAINGILFLRSKNPFDFQGISFYAKSGLTSQDAAGENAYYDFGIRAAHAFSDKFAIKANFSFLTGEDWHANSIIDIENPGLTRADPGYDGLNVYGDEVATTLNFDAAAGLPSGTVGSAFVSRTGYDEADLIDYQAQSVKADFSVFYRPFADDLELIYQGRIGRGNSVFQGANRNALRDFNLQTHKVEIRNKNFFIRGYTTSESSGNSYDTRFTGININRLFKSDTQWFTEYAQTFIGASLGVGTGVLATEEQAHAAARAVADAGRFEPGTAAFQSAFNTVTADGDLSTGSKFIDNTAFNHVNGNYNIAHLINDWAEIQLGGSYREYRLRSEGTIFTDFDGPIIYDEYGFYGQAQKKVIDDRVKFTLSGRVDKNEFFDAVFSPRAGVTVTLGKNKNHIIRTSWQRAFRNPTTQDLFIGLNAGAAILVGSAPDNLDRDVRTFDLSDAGQVVTGQGSVEIVGRAAYENAFLATDLATGVITPVNTPIIQPEQVTAYELGYRTQLGKFSIDLNGYYNSFSDFIVNTFVVVPLYGTAGDNALSLLALQNGDTQVYQTYTNSQADISSYGGAIGVDTKIGGFDLGVNYTYNKLQDEEELRASGIRVNYNTPEHKVKASFGKTDLFKNFGFNFNYRWSDTFFWESTFADGDVPAYSVVDAQINYNVPSIKSSFKAGA
ncbi:TonB-dependent receptor, partial [bacterium]|nr:TonB-dependent receptor [bacterium]